MAVVVSIARGHDASYPFKTTDAAEGPVITGQCGAGYSLSVVEEVGEPLRAGGSGFRVHLPACQQGPGDRRVPRRHRPVVLPLAADHQDSARRPVRERPWARAGSAGAREHASVRQRDDAPRKGARRAGPSPHCCAAGDGPRRVAELGTLRDLAGTVWHAAPRKRPQERVVTQARNSRRAGNSRMRKNARPWQSAALLGADLGQPQTQPRAGGWRLDGRPG